jgi:type I restriction enzyme M protein
MFESAFRSIDDTLWKDAGCTGELDYIEQTSWLLFLKYLDDYEQELASQATLEGRAYSPLMDERYQWKHWAAPKNAAGHIDYQRALTGDDLLDFVNDDLFPYLERFKRTTDDPSSLKYKIGEIFNEIGNKLQSGYSLRDVIDKVDELSFSTNAEQYELSSLYEDKIKNMGNAGRNGGEYYTPRPLIEAIVKVVNPVIGETVYDGAVGSAGFLCAAFEHIKGSRQLSPSEWQQLQSRTLYGKEKKSLAYVIGTMNMILHGVSAPNLVHTNTLNENLDDIQPSEQVDVVLANPPFGGKERAEIQQNFPIKTGETAYLFLQHFIKKLKKGGRCGVVIKNTFLSNTDNASIAIRKQLLTECNLHTILDLPGGTFIGAGVKTVVLFFEKGEPTEDIWYYQLNVGRNMGKTNPLNDRDIEEFVSLARSRADSDNSWRMPVADLSTDTWDLTVRNPNTVEEVDNRTPSEIIAEIEELDAQASEALQKIKEIL